MLVKIRENERGYHLVCTYILTKEKHQIFVFSIQYYILVNTKYEFLFIKSINFIRKLIWVSKYEFLFIKNINFIRKRIKKFLIMNFYLIKISITLENFLNSL